jgi:uncharacterized repeat protein (TIGR04002 family)
MKTKKNIRYITLTGAFAALITLFTAYFVHIPVGLNGGYIHLGDSIIYLAAAILPAPYSLLAGAIGGGLADLLTAPMWTLPTVIIKMLIVLPFTSKNAKILGRRNLFAPVLSFILSATGYYFAEYLLFGTWGVILTSLAESFIQSMGSAVVFWAIAAAFDKVNVKARILSGNTAVSRAGTKEVSEG